MKAHIERHQCRYCQIDLVNIQQSTASTTQITRVEQPPTSVMKCPVCGYSELGEPSSVENHTIHSKIAIIGYQAPAA